MSRQASRDTGPELQLRRELHRRGERYRVHDRPLPGIRSTPDITFTRARVVVFVDGCFWHSCPQHATHPINNAEWWRQKLDANVVRDRRTDQAFADAGWTVVRVWEHEDTRAAADRIIDIVRERRQPR